MKRLTVNDLSAEEKQAVLDHLELLRSAGIEAEDYGGPTVIVRAVPADVPVDDVADMLLELADKLKDGGRDALRSVLPELRRKSKRIFLPNYICPSIPKFFAPHFEILEFNFLLIVLLFLEFLHLPSFFLIHQLILVKH